VTSRVGTLATLICINNFFIIKVLREVLREKGIVLIYGGYTHKFVNEKLTTTKKMRTKSFSSFDVTVGNGNITPCKKYMPNIKFIFKYYTIEDKFFIFPLAYSSHVFLWVK